MPNRDRGLEREWRRRMRARDTSGLTVREFCEAAGVAESAFYSWRRELQRRDAERCGVVREHLERNVLDGGLFVFLNQRRNRIKLLYWDRDGLAIWQKRLERGTFSPPACRADLASVTLTASELALLLDGLEVITTRRSPRYHRATVTV